MNGDLISRSAVIEYCKRQATEPWNQKAAPVTWADAYVAFADDVEEDFLGVDAVVLPCKVGDTVWGIRNYKGINHPQEGKVDQMYYTNDMRLHIKIKHICIGEWGKKIFPTREEAEAALKRRNDNA